jgi:hypothetical protein
MTCVPSLDAGIRNRALLAGDIPELLSLPPLTLLSLYSMPLQVLTLIVGILSHLTYCDSGLAKEAHARGGIWKYHWYAIMDSWYCRLGFPTVRVMGRVGPPVGTHNPTRREA